MASRTRKNDQWLRVLEAVQGEEERDSNKWMVYNKAISSLKKEAEEYTDADALLKVKFIGPKIVSDLKKLVKKPDTSGGDSHPNVPSPGKRKRGSDAKSATGAAHSKERGRPQQLFTPDTDDEVAVPACKRLYPPLHIEDNMFSFGGRSESSAAEPMLEAPSHRLNTQPHSYRPTANPVPEIEYEFGRPSFPFSSQGLDIFQRHRAAGVDHDNALPSQVGDEGTMLPFFYVNDREQCKRSCDAALVDIHNNALWYKICFLRRDASIEHPVVQTLRMFPETRKGKGREELIEAWISDETVERFNLQQALGFTESISSTSASASSSQTFASRLGANRAFITTLDNSLESLLNAENKKKRIMLDPARKLNMNKEWEVGNNKTAIDLGDWKGKRMTEVQLVRSESGDIATKEKLAAAATLRLQGSLSDTSATAQSSQLGLPQILVVPALRKAGTHPLIPNAAIVQPLTSQRQLQAYAILPTALSSTTSGPLPACAPVVASLSRNRAAGLNRGRVSDFAPAPSAVDDFDVHLDRQAAGSSSHASADLIDTITDLTFGPPFFPAFDPIVFSPGSYEIILYLDNREIKAKNARDYIYKELLNKGVNVEQRSLAVGDILWVARRRYPVRDVVNNECVLDIILERKRLDDLCQSIKSGRFHEQKFRLAETGLKVFYLVEEYETAKHKEFFGVQIDTARSSTQVVDGFILKETRKISYTISYLATMHQTINDLYKGKPLYIIPPHLVKRSSYTAFQKHFRHTQPDTPYFTSYQCFDRLFGKSANLTSRDLLAQMLLCVKGLSPEKAATIIEEYPTMRHLWEAFVLADGIEKDARLSHEAREGGGRMRMKILEAKAMLCRINTKGKGRQKIGPVLSEKVYNLLRKKTYHEYSDED